MSYLGLPLEECGVIPSNWGNASLVVISGDGPNVCGHALINVDAYYLHIAASTFRPCFMPEQGYRCYLDESGKTELFRRPIYLPDPDGARRRLNELVVDPWYWFGTPNNSVSFVQELVRAGGVDESILSSCPVRWR